MVETHAQRINGVFRELAALRVGAESDDGLVAAVVDHRGRLRQLRLDPRVYRNPDADGLARGVVTTARAAADLAHREAVEVSAVLLPGHRDPDDTDLAFDPVIEELDRLIANPPRPHHGDPPDASLPVLRTGLDFVAFRRNLLDLRERMADISATAESDDGLISATTDGHGRLLDLELDRRLYRVPDSRRLAAAITGAVGEAADRARDEVAAASGAIWAARSARRRT
jgi:DNA-binding protein YbaB